MNLTILLILTETLFLPNQQHCKYIKIMNLTKL